jgi:predicted transposase YdaD
VIDRVPNEAHRANLLAVTQVFTGLRYNDPELLTILGGSRVMIESPLLREMVERGEARGEARGKASGRIEARIEDILRILADRFDTVPPEIRDLLTHIQDERVLEALVTHATLCPSLADFRSHLPG